MNKLCKCLLTSRFKPADFDKFCTVLTNAVCIPVQTEAVPYIMSSGPDSLLTPLHDSILECMELIQKVINFIISTVSK